MEQIIITAGQPGGPGKIQDAVNSLDSKGGKITLKAGRHLSAPLVLTSDIHLELESGAELAFADDFSLCGIVKTRWEGVECYALQALIYAENASGVRISGYGTINGRGSRWWSAYRAVRNGKSPDEVKKIQKKLLTLNAECAGGSGGGGRETGFLRPPLIQMKNCTSVTIEGVELENSPFWNTHILYCENVNLKKLSFKNPPGSPNTDGLDIDSSKHVVIDGCNFNVGDDCLCIKSGMDDDGIRIGRVSSDITVRNCRMENGHGGIVLGSETSGGIENIRVSDCVMTDTDRGIRIKTRRGRGGTIKNIFLKNIMMRGVAAPIVMNMFYRCGAEQDAFERLSSPVIPAEINTKTTPVIQDVIIENIKAENIRSSAAFFLGLPESRIKNLSVKDFSASSAPFCVFEKPAMDFFYTEACGPVMLHQFLEDPHFENITVDNETGNIMIEIHPGMKDD